MRGTLDCYEFRKWPGRRVEKAHNIMMFVRPEHIGRLEIRSSSYQADSTRSRWLVESRQIWIPVSLVDTDWRTGCTEVLVVSRRTPTSALMSDLAEPERHRERRKERVWERLILEVKTIHFLVLCLKWNSASLPEAQDEKQTHKQHWTRTQHSHSEILEAR